MWWRSLNTNKVFPLFLNNKFGDHIQRTASCLWLIKLTDLYPKTYKIPSNSDLIWPFPSFSKCLNDSAAETKQIHSHYCRKRHFKLNLCYHFPVFTNFQKIFILMNMLDLLQNVTWSCKFYSLYILHFALKYNFTFFYMKNCCNCFHVLISQSQWGCCELRDSWITK